MGQDILGCLSKIFDYRSPWDIMFCFFLIRGCNPFFGKCDDLSLRGSVSKLPVMEVHLTFI